MTRFLSAMCAALVQGSRVDIWDSSNGQHRPVFAVQAGHTALGGHFLWCHLGAHQIACYSLLTGNETLSTFQSMLLYCNVIELERQPAE